MRDGVPVTDWVDFDQWVNCVEMERPGFVFELENVEGLRLLTPCVGTVELPWDSKSGPVRFRLIEEPKPRHSSPLPKPQQ